MREHQQAERRQVMASEDVVKEARELLLSADTLPDSAHSIEHALWADAIERQHESPFWGHSKAIAAIYARVPKLLSAMADEVERLHNLIVHMHVHSGYRDNGYMQMTTEQKALYDAIWNRSVEELDREERRSMANEFPEARAVQMRGDFQEDIRHADLPRHKEAVMSELYGEVIGWLVAQGLTRGKEFEARSQDVLQCSKKVIWIDRLHPEKQITWVFNSIQMMVEFGVVLKADKNVVHREKLNDLRYQISTGSEIALTDGSREKFDTLLKSFKQQFEGLRVSGDVNE